MKTETNLTSNLVIGLGEIGTAIQTILQCEGIDVGHLIPEATVIHICFPYTEKFEDFVKEYQKLTSAKYIIIHSTVPVGVSSRLNAIHSPVRGVHPHLEEGIRTFTKYFGGKEAYIGASIFEKVGMTCITCDTPETTEIMKLVDTTTYGVNILIEKEIKRLCDENKVPFEMVYTHANSTYNDGYAKLGMPYFSKYILKHYDGKIGGHCINENSKLLKSWMNDLLNSHLNS